MKPFIGIDITEDKKNETCNGLEFVAAEISEPRSRVLVKAAQKTMDVVEETKLPLPVRIIHWICGAYGLLAAAAILRVVVDKESVGFAQGYQNAPWLCWSSGICLLVWLVLKIISKRKEKAVLESDEGSHTIESLKKAESSAYAELGVPSSAPCVDVLSFTYRVKNGLPVAKERGLSPTPYTNFESRIFVEDGQLFLTDLEKKYAFPLSELRGIRTVNKKLLIPSWNKDVRPNQGRYKAYKMVVNNYGVYFKPYHILELEHGGETWGIYFPCYELPVFEELTGLKAE